MSEKMLVTQALEEKRNRVTLQENIPIGKIGLLTLKAAQLERAHD